MLLEVERVICVFLDHFEDLNRLCNDLNTVVSICENQVRRLVLPLDQRHHLDAISTRYPTNLQIP